MSPVSIWNYDALVASPAETAAYVHSKRCIYCQTDMSVIGSYHNSSGPPSISKDTFSASTKVCSACGWWAASQSITSLLGSEWLGSIRTQIYEETYQGGVGSLREFDVAAPDAAIDELRQYLRARYEARHVVDPWRFEHVVASVFRNVDWNIRVTARSNDGGLDVILEEQNGTMTGIQVKRHRGAIKVDQIHALAGALVRGGFTKGIFVTTGRFQPGAGRAARELSARGVPIELIDADRFFDRLGLSQMNEHSGLRLSSLRPLHVLHTSRFNAP